MYGNSYFIVFPLASPNCLVIVKPVVFLLPGRPYMINKCYSVESVLVNFSGLYNGCSIQIFIKYIIIICSFLEGKRIYLWIYL